MPARAMRHVPSVLVSVSVLMLFMVACRGGPQSPSPEDLSGDSVLVENIDLDASSSSSTSHVPEQSGPLRILSASPAGQLQSRQTPQPISVTFSRSMVALGKNEAPPDDALTLDPAVPGSLRWEGTQTLVFTPDASLPPATEITARLSAGVADRDGNTRSEPYTWSFQTPRPRLVSSHPEDDARFVAPDDSIRLSFSLPVDADTAANYLEGEDLRIGAVRNDGDSTLVVHPSHSLERGTQYRITAKAGLPSSGHELGLADDQTVHFRVRPNLELVDLRQPGADTAPFYPDRGLELVFSTPVRFEDVRRAVSFEPDLSLLPGAESRDANRGTRHVLPATLAPDTTYTLTIDRLQDQFGQSIAPVERTFRTRAFEPHLSVEEGRMVIEADQHPVVPLQATNVGSVTLGMESLSADEIVPALPTYDQTYHGYDRPDDAPTHPGVQADRSYELPIPDNKLETVPLRLDSMLTDGTGLVGLRVAHPELGPRSDSTDKWALAQVTRLGVTGKFSPHQNLIFVTTLDGGTPVEGATVTIRDAHNEVHWKGTTDASGRVQTPGWSEFGLEKPDDYTKPVQYAIVEHEGDVAFTGSKYDTGTEPWRFNIDYDWAPEAETKTGKVFSDRGLYKTGHTVHLKGILRTKTSGEWASVQDSVAVRIDGPRQNVVLERRVSPSALGTFDLEWPIPNDAPLGSYWVRVRTLADDESTIVSDPFQVKAFRRARFSVNAETIRDEYVAGDFFEGRISAHYLFGADMEGQPVTYDLETAATSYRPPGYEGFRFGPLDTGYYWDDLLHKETTLDSTSSVEADRTLLSGNENGEPRELTWRGTVTSPSRQKSTDRATALLHPGRYYVGLKPSTSFLDLSTDSTLAVDVVTTEPGGASVGDKDVTVELVKLQWNSVQEVGADGRLTWNSEKTETVVRSADVTTQTGQISRLHMTVPSGGQYRLRAKSQDLRGNAIRSETYLYASGSGYVAWQRNDDDQINVVPEQTDYAPGETARLMVQSPYEEATALITVEREGILTSRVDTLTGSTPMIELPITEDYLPNVFVSVILLKGRTAAPEVAQDPGRPSFKIGYAPLSVDPDQQHLRVEVRPDQDEYRPGEEATVDLRLANADGEGVPGEITFSAADAGVLNLIGYELPDPFDTFYGTRSLGVTTTESRADLIEQRNYGQKAEEAGGGGGAAGQNAGVREDFSPLAHWAPALQTDASGEASVTFELPESLTTFRFMATALTKDHKFGADQTDVVVTKPLVLKPALPRFARRGDKFEAGVLVTNRSDEDGTATISASTEGLSLRNDSTKTVDLPAGATKEVRFDWAAPTVGPADVTFEGELNGETDALATTLPVNRPTTKRVDATFAFTQSEAQEAFRLPEDRISDLSTFDVTLSSTALGGLDGAVEHLFNYPYGCLEQRTSRVRPLLAGDDLLNTFDLNAFEAGNREEVVQEWMDALPSYWAGNGFSLWEGGDHVNEYVTGYVLLALADAEQAGYDLPEALTRKTEEAVADIVRNRSDRPEYYSDDVWRDTRAFLLYALARHGRVLESELNWLADHPPTSVEGQSHLLQTLLATDQIDRPDVREQLATQLKQRIRVDGSTAYLEAPDDDNYDWIFSSDVRATATGLTALLKATPSGDLQQLAQRMVRSLMERRQQGHWASTQDNAAVLTAFQHYVDAYETDTPDLSASVKLAGQSILDGAFQGRTLKTLSKTVAPDALPADREIPVSATASGTGRLYYSMRLTTYTDAPQDALAEGLQVERRIQRLDDSGEPTGAPVRTGNQSISLEPGELVKVTLHLSTPTSRSYVAVDDALPAGLEPINEDFATTNQGVVGAADPGADRWWGSFNHTEQHDDRVVLFADYLRAGDHTYSYVARATTPGTFEHPPAEAEMMYRPETRGRTATGTVIVEPPANPTAER